MSGSVSFIMNYLTYFFLRSIYIINVGHFLFTVFLLVAKKSFVFQVSGASSLFESTEENAPNVAKDKIAELRRSQWNPFHPLKTALRLEKPVGAVSLFGGIDVLADKQDTSKVSKMFTK